MSIHTAQRRFLLLGHPRSGTTLLRRILGAHPDVAAPPETHLFSACARFLRSESTAQGVDMGVLSGLYFADFDDEDILGRLRSMAYSILDEYADKQNKTKWVEKTAFDIYHLKEIERLCGDTIAYLGIIRHPLDVAVSCRDFFCDSLGMFPAPVHDYIRRYEQPVEAFVRSWTDTTEALIDLGQRRNERCLIVRYEDLVDEPESVVESLLDFCGVAAGGDLVRAALDDNVSHLGFSDHKSYQTTEIHKQSVERWRSLPGPQIERLAPLINPLLELCDYDPVPSGGEHSVQDLRNRYVSSLAVNARAGKTKR